MCVRACAQARACVRKCVCICRNKWNKRNRGSRRPSADAGFGVFRFLFRFAPDRNTLEQARIRNRSGLVALKLFGPPRHRPCVQLSRDLILRSRP